MSVENVAPNIVGLSMAAVRRIGLLALAVFTALLLAMAPMVASADLSWNHVEGGDLPSELQPWFDASIEERGIHVLAAGSARYLLIAWGEKPSSGYEIEVHSVAEGLDEDLIQVDAELIAPDSEDGTPSYPHALMELPPGYETVHVNFMGETWLEGALADDPEDDDVLVLMAAIERDDGTVGNPLVVEGRGRLFEATMNLVLEDGHFQLRNHWLTLAAAGPEWAEFAVAVTYDDPSSDHGTVIAAWDDPESGDYEELAHVPVTFGPASLRLADVDGHWAEGPIRLGVLAGFIHGYPDKTFLADQTVTRAEFIKMLAAGTDEGASETDTTDIPFDDAQTHWAAAYIAYALGQGWVDAEEEGDMFHPDQVVTEEDMMRWAARAAGVSEMDDAPAGLTRGDAVILVWQSLWLQE